MRHGSSHASRRSRPFVCGNGFELTRQVKEDTDTADVPVILVTSLDSVEDKTQGIEAGADAYIVKSSFDQHNLLETIEQLI